MVLITQIMCSILPLLFNFGKMLLFFVCFFSNWKDAKSEAINVNILVLYSGSGSLAFISDTITIAKYWEKHLADSLSSDPTWPFNATIEFIDVQSDPDITTKRLLDRINNRKLANVTAIIGPESQYLGYPAAQIAAQYGIPCLLAVCSANIYTPKQPQLLRTSFLTLPPFMYMFRTLVDVFVANKVRSLVAVAMLEPGNPYNDGTCFGTAELASTRGINVLAQLTLSYSDNSEDVFNLVKMIKNNYDPDAIIWCDWASCALPDNIQTYNPLPAFRKANYLPKSLSMLDCLDEQSVTSLYQEGLFDYVSTGQYVNIKLRGSEYTEDSTPYSSMFRPVTPTNYSVIIDLYILTVT